MGFLAQGAIGHGTRLKAADDALYRLNLIQGNTVALLKAQKAAQAGLVLVTDHALIFLIELIIVVPDRSLNGMYGLRIIQVLLAVTLNLEASARGQGLIHTGQGLFMAAEAFALNILKGHAAHTADRSGKVIVNNLLGETYGLEDLGPDIAVHTGDTHFGHNLQDTVIHGMDIVFNSLLLGDSRNVPGFYHIRNHIIGTSGEDGLYAVTQKTG